MVKADLLRRYDQSSDPTIAVFEQEKTRQRLRFKENLGHRRLLTAADQPDWVHLRGAGVAIESVISHCALKPVSLPVTETYIVKTCPDASGNACRVKEGAWEIFVGEDTLYGIDDDSLSRAARIEKIAGILPDRGDISGIVRQGFTDIRRDNRCNRAGGGDIPWAPYTPAHEAVHSTEGQIIIPLDEQTPPVVLAELTQISGQPILESARDDIEIWRLMFGLRTPGEKEKVVAVVSGLQADFQWLSPKGKFPIGPSGAGRRMSEALTEMTGRIGCRVLERVWTDPSGRLKSLSTDGETHQDFGRGWTSDAFRRALGRLVEQRFDYPYEVESGITVKMIEEAGGSIEPDEILEILIDTVGLRALLTSYTTPAGMVSLKEIFNEACGDPHAFSDLIQFCGKLDLISAQLCHVKPGPMTILEQYLDGEEVDDNDLNHIFMKLTEYAFTMEMIRRRYNR